MKNSGVNKPSIRNIGAAARQSVRLAQDALVKFDHFDEARFPLVLTPAVEDISLAGWAATNRVLIEEFLLTRGAILFRGFKVRGAGEFEDLIKTVSGRLLDYTYRSTPRSRVSGSIFTSTEYPAHQSIPLHNEMSYSLDWPMKIWFFCLKSAQQGGETPIVDSRRIYQLIAPEIRKRFEEKKVMYVRNYGNGLDLSWQEVFQTESRAEVESYCKKAAIDFEWVGPNQLRTRQICQSVGAHPKTKEKVWFNQAHLFHLSSLEPAIRESLLAQYKQEDLPRNAYYGDGQSIESSVLDEIRALFRSEAVRFPWQDGDILLLDNMLTGHGRESFSGARQVVVGMSEPFSGQGA